MKSFSSTSVVASLAVGLLSALFASPALAQSKPTDQAGLPSSGNAATSQAASEEVQAEVRKIDKSSSKVTLRHGDIKSLNMPAMTMVFQVKDGASLDQLKVGDKIKFKVINDGGKFTITEMKAVP